MNTFWFYDIECLNNVFSVALYNPTTQAVQIYFQIEVNTPWANQCSDTQALVSTIQKANPNANIKTIDFYNLATNYGLEQLKKHFPLTEEEIVTRTDPTYQDSTHPFYVGYNSKQYDCTMLAHYMQNQWNRKEKYLPFLQPATFRKDNDTLFDLYRENMPSFLKTGNTFDQRYNLYRMWLNSGRFIDNALLNEKQYKIGLKRLLGALGYQILESDKLSNDPTIYNFQEFCDLLAYNVSDVIGLYHLFEHPVYKTSFNLKKSLLDTYSELEVDPKKQKRRSYALTSDSTSANLSGHILCPDGYLDDIEEVSYMYPHPNAPIVKETGIQPFNVLEFVNNFMKENIAPQGYAKWKPIYDSYKAIEGKNFNHSLRYTGCLPAKNTSDYPIQDNNLCYQTADGQDTSCFVTFSIGGIHGAQYNKALFDKHMQQYQTEKARLQQIKEIFQGDPLACKQAKKIEMDGQTINTKDFVQTKGTIKLLQSLSFEARQKYWKEPKPPVLFQSEKNGSTKLNKKYTFTSAAIVNHEDFTSYYPSLLMNLMAFYNSDLGEDRYRTIFEQKEMYGKLMKDPSISDEQKNNYDLARDGTKLILNSATGSADVNYDTPIRMNNQILSMRIIGQLFTFYIGQYQTLYGNAEVISTNTDGLYTVLEKTINNQLLDQAKANIKIGIKPEQLLLISKDSNNRLEVVLKNNKPTIVSVGGSHLTAYKGYNPQNALTAPPIVDYVLSKVLIKHAITGKMDQPLNKDDVCTFIQHILDHPQKHGFSDFECLNMLHYIVASSATTHQYVVSKEKPTQPVLNELSPADSNPAKILQHYNRIFFVKDSCPQKAYITKCIARKRPGTDFKNHDPYAFKLLQQKGYDNSFYNIERREATFNKVTNVEESQPVWIYNKDLHLLSQQQIQAIFNQIDISALADIVISRYTKSWQNKTA